MANPEVFTMVLAGGEGKRLMPLTLDRAKPAVPFGGNYRLIDFALSNLVNAGFRRIVVLTQYKSHSLDRHIAQTWHLSPLLGNYVTPVPAQMRRGPRWFAGSADAIYQNFNLLHDELAVSAVDEVREHEVDHAVHAAERDGGLGPVRGQGHQPLPLSAGEDDGQDLGLGHAIRLWPHAFPRSRRERGPAGPGCPSV